MRTLPNWLTLGQFLWMVLICFYWALDNIPIAEGRTETYEIATLCNRQYQNNKYHRNVDGAVIISRSEKDLDCTVTFAAEYVSQHFLIRFDEYNMDCSDRLFIYDSASDVGTPLVDLSCRYMKPEQIPILTTKRHYLTIKFVADKFGTDANKFTMIITAFKDPALGCHDSFSCSTNNKPMCISTRLLCDGVNNCGDGEDESRSANCTSNFLLDVVSKVGESPTHMAILGGLLVISTVIVILCSCFCRQNNRSSLPPQPDLHNHSKYLREPSHGSNGAGTMITMTDKTGLHTFHHAQSSTLESLRGSGNLHLPAGHFAQPKRRVVRLSEHIFEESNFGERRPNNNNNQH